VTPLEGLRAAAPDLELHQADGHDPAAAAALAARSDAAVLVLGWPAAGTREWAARLGIAALGL
jgi:beta-glucosidase